MRYLHGAQKWHEDPEEEEPGHTLKLLGTEHIVARSSGGERSSRGRFSA